MDKKRSKEEIYKSLKKQKIKRIRFIVLFILMLIFMTAVSVYFIVFNNIDNFLGYFQK